MQGVESNPDVKSVVLLSAKPGCWIAGADIKYGSKTFFCNFDTFLYKITGMLKMCTGSVSILIVVFISQA